MHTHTLAHTGLGMLHLNGFGGDANMTAAYDAFMRGAEQEHCDSLYTQAWACCTGTALAAMPT